ncbi:hypothetical protein P692DRAFT_20827561 [Suillus brevipes Sb2]|nr:hypothetical protein P692DRAFT_20827561 [Suillus brevipes Sb2]
MSTALYVDAGIQASKVCTMRIGTFAVIIFDYCITLDAESQWVWHRKWTLVRFVFTVSRYVPFFGIGLTFVGLLMTRICASWHSKRILISLPVFGAICLVTAFILSNSGLVNHRSSGGIQPPSPGDCLFLSGRGGVFSYAALLLFELVLFCSLLFIRFRRYKDTYMICIMIMSSFSILLTQLTPVSCVVVVIHSVLASRILFNLRESEEHSRMQEELSEILVSSGTIRFAEP